MAGHKLDRLSEDLKHEIAAVMRELKDPRVSGMLSIVKLDLSRDQSYCKVYISAIEGMEKARKAVEGLNSAEGFIKRELTARIKMRRCPELQFIADDSIEKSIEFNDMIARLNKGKEQQ